jgi:ribosomal protein S12 methylthiotransferase accessory factor
VDICFPGGLRVEALHQGFWIRTDQPVPQGGGGKAPSPFDLFLASIGTCAGFYALRFCQQRNLRTDGLAMTLTAERDSERKKVVRVRLEISLPIDFPEKYRTAIVHAIDQCSVKKHLQHPPAFEVLVSAPPGEAVEATTAAPAPGASAHA